MRVIASANMFIYATRKHIETKYQTKIEKRHFKVISIDNQETFKQSFDIALIFRPIKIIWMCNLSGWLWFNLITSPFIILWPSLSDEGINKNLWYLFWLNELFWAFDIIRKFFDPTKSNQHLDAYEVTVNYIKSTLIFDLVALLPQLVTGLNPTFVWFKIIRLYQVDLLHYPLETLINIYYS